METSNIQITVVNKDPIRGVPVRNNVLCLQVISPVADGKRESVQKGGK